MNTPTRLTPRQVLQRLARLERAGVRYVSRRAVQAATPAVTLPERVELARQPEPAPTISRIEEPESMTPVARKKAPPEDRRAALAVVQREVAGCRRCPHLAAARTQTVFGVGNIHPRLVFLGEAPGADEDAQGEPFVGRAGQLLTKIIEACTLRREDVYILNVLKCRPPGNRNPEPDEVANCRGYLDRQLEILKPEYICCLGSVAAKTLLETEQTIGRLRNHWHEYRGTPVWCTYHPSYLLRNPAAKKDVWEDMKTLMRKMGIDVEKRG